MLNATNFASNPNDKTIAIFAEELRQKGPFGSKTIKDLAQLLLVRNDGSIDRIGLVLLVKQPYNHGIIPRNVATVPFGNTTFKVRNAPTHRDESHPASGQSMCIE